MKSHTRLMIALLTAWMLSGCATTAPVAGGANPSSLSPASSPDSGRMLIWQARLSLEVARIDDAATRVGEVASQAGGHVESRSDSGDKKATVTIRVPAAALTPTMASLETIGEVNSRWVSSRDVTEQYVDTDARLKNLTALRDRLRALLDKAGEVKDILSIETELSRVQGEIDSMQATLKSLQGRVDLASIQVSLERKPVLGPLGLFFKGAWWAVGKLFVIRD